MQTIMEQIESKEPVIGDITEIDDLKKNLYQNSIPMEIISMDYLNYKDFLNQRRKWQRK